MFNITFWFKVTCQSITMQLVWSIQRKAYLNSKQSQCYTSSKLNAKLNELSEEYIPSSTQTKSKSLPMLRQTFQNVKHDGSLT
ncbi:MAG: hypothetical protein ACTS6P_01425 [Candidatus Hodgkinia cicadicola]